MRGKSISLSPARRLVCDLLHAAKSMPTVPVQRRMWLGNLVAARAAHPGRPSWLAIFTRAYARVAQALPQIRRAYVKLPWPHLYEYPGSVASITIERVYLNENTVFIGRIKNPAEMTVMEVSRRIREFQNVPVAECVAFRQALRVGGLPKPARRLLWWLGLNIGRQRANHFGTFGVTAYSALGAESLHPLYVSSTTVNYGVIDPDGNVNVRVVYDHRVIDGADVARALNLLESELTCATLAELQAPGR